MSQFSRHAMLKSGFTTHTRYLLQPIPFTVRVFVVPDLFAGKMYAVLCHRWKNRVKGRGWYDLIWYAANHPDLNLYHLEQRLRQTAEWQGKTLLTSDRFRLLMEEAIKSLDVDQARREVIPFTRNPDALAVWSRDFFRDVADRIRFAER